MPGTDIILGEDDVEVRAADLSVFDPDGDSTFRADEVVPSRITLGRDDEDEHLSIDINSLAWTNEVGTLNLTPERIFLPSKAGSDSTTVTADLLAARDEVLTGNVEATDGHFVDGTFGGNAYGVEEPTPGRVEVRDGQGGQAVLLDGDDPRVGSDLGFFRGLFVGGDLPTSDIPKTGFVRVLDASDSLTVLLDGNRGVVETTGGDVAEYFPNGTDRTFDGGDVVGLEDGAVTDAVADAEAAFVVASTPMLLGNRQPDADDGEHVPLALLGQVPVRIAADVRAGDRLVATADGRAAPAGDGEADAPTVGRALESAAADGTATALVGYSPPARPARDRRQDGAGARLDAVESATRDLAAALDEKDDRIDALTAENGDLHAENEALRERLAAVEERLAAVEGTAGAAPADD